MSIITVLLQPLKLLDTNPRGAQAPQPPPAEKLLTKSCRQIIKQHPAKAKATTPAIQHHTKPHIPTLPSSSPYRHHNTASNPASTTAKPAWRVEVRLSALPVNPAIGELVLPPVL